MTKPLTEAAGANRGRSLLQNVLAFSDMLKKAGLDATTGRVIDVCRSLQHIDISNREDFYYALRTNLVSRAEEIERFDRLFNLFWGLDSVVAELPGGDGDKGETCDSLCPDVEKGGDRGESFIDDWYDGEPQASLEKKALATYSPDEVLATKDFCAITGDEVKEIQRLIASIAPRLATVKSRRRESCAGGSETDLRRTLRRSMARYGAEIVELARKQRKIRKVKVVLLCDVSGSMDCYSKFLIQFVYGLQNQLKWAETFVFSTRLTRVTPLLKGRRIRDALEALSAGVEDWSGGTCIGDCLHTFNERYSQGIDRRTVVIIISDGWDRGNIEVVVREMRRLRAKFRKVIWLNPLLGNANYRPVTRGMQAALPFIDYFLPAHNLNSLVTLGKTLKSLCQ
ncbi:MAG: VWA domain-containing protein [Chloroflexi bacterium]|nr:VWA domain-containing protein [Chloroflexota bacterium]